MARGALFAFPFTSKGARQSMAAQPPTSRSAPTSSENDETSGHLQPVRILIVEDDYFVATALETNLQEAGFGVVGIAVTAEEAVEMAAAEKPSLAIVDIRLAGKRDGIEAAIELLKRHSVRSIFATAHTDAETTKRAERANPAGWLSKPYANDSLLSLLREVLGSE